MEDMKELDDLDDFEEFERFEEVENSFRIRKTYLRDQENPLEAYSDVQFRRTFRFNKDTVVHLLLPIVFPANVIATSRRGLPLPPTIQMCVALRYYASSSYQTVCGNLFKISQPSVHRIIRNVSETLCKSIVRFIKLPQTTLEIQKTWREFHEKARFPDVIGIIDGTHVPINSPGGDHAELFRNQRGHFSINVQIVCGPNEEIFDIVCRWPGSVHKSRIFEYSSISARLKQDSPRLGHLLGDAGYSQKPYLFTPILNPTTDPERRYNSAHNITRSLVERTISTWKRRFPCLCFELKTTLTHTLRIIPACAVLHNLGIRAGDPWAAEDGEELTPTHYDEPPPPVLAENPTDDRFRTEFINRHFSV